MPTWNEGISSDNQHLAHSSITAYQQTTSNHTHLTHLSEITHTNTGEEGSTLTGTEHEHMCENSAVQEEPEPLTLTCTEGFKTSLAAPFARY